MGFLGGLANVAGLQMANIEANPEQAAVGANTPESTYAMNKTVAPTMDKHYTPTVNMMGGATQGEMQQNAAQGYDNTGPMAANAVGNAAAMYFTGGAATPLVAGQMAADRYSANNPNSNFDREYNGRVLAANANVNAGINQQLNVGMNQGMAMNNYAKGGLAAAAHHLQSQGRGQDTHLVHMTSSELNAMQHLAKSRGGSLTINPKTGLPEAGFLSTALPMVLGAAAAATGQEWAVPLAMAMSAGGEYAYTGSLTQGLMAGLSAWGGAGLESGIEGLGSATMDTSAGLTSAGAESVPTEALPQGSSEFQAAQSNLGPEAENMSANQVANANVLPSTPNAPGPSSMDLLGKGLTSGNLMDYAGSHLGQVASVGLPLLASSGNLFSNRTGTAPTSTGQKNPFGMKEIPKDANGNPIFNATLPAPPSPAYKPTYRDYVANPYTPVGSADGGLMQDKLDYASGGMFPGSQIDKTQYSSSPQMPASMQQTMAGYDPMTNPLTGEEVQHMADGGLPYIQQAQNQPGTANGYTPAGSGSTYGQGQYSPQTAASQPMEGGLPMLNQMNPFTQQGMPPQGMPAPQTNFAMGGIAQYAGNTDWGSLVSGQNEVQSGLEMATRRPSVQLQHADPGIYTPEASVKDMDPLQSTMYYLNKVAAPVPKGLKSLPKPGTLGAITHTPAAQAAAEAQAKQSIASEQAPQEAKEGGLMAMADGGSPIYHPQYANYAQTPYSPQASQGIPMPTRGSGIPAQGYAMDPLKMQGSPAYNANQAAQQAQLQQIMAAAGGMASGGLSGYANGGMSNLGGYSDGGHLLKGPGDGVSDSIPATIGGKQPARLAEGEFVIPARIVSELGNGSTDAGAKRLYAMMDRIKAKRSKTKNIAADTKAYKYLPA